MPFDEPTTGAMPGPSAMRGQAGRTGGPISWPRIPREGEGNQSGANGGNAGAGASGSTDGNAGTRDAAGAGNDTRSTATGDEGLGDAGKRAIAAERTAREAAETKAKQAEARVAELEAATQSDQDKAISKARTEAETAERDKWTSHIRSSEVRAALSRAGLTDEKTLALAAGAPVFATLKVADNGSVERLPETVEQFKKDYPAMFAEPTTTTRQGGAWDGAAGGGGANDRPVTLQDAVSERLSKQR